MARGVSARRVTRMNARRAGQPGHARAAGAARLPFGKARAALRRWRDRSWVLAPLRCRMPERAPGPDPIAALALSPSLAALVARGTRARYPKHAVLINEGDVEDALFVILSGQVRVYSSGPRGNELTLGIYGAGEYIGEMSLDGSPRSASVATLEPTECARVSGRVLKEHIAEHPDFAFELLAKVIRRARAATVSATQVALNDVYGRLAQLLRSLARPDARSRGVIEQRLTHLEMASRLGCSREMVSRLMKDLERGGYVVRDGAQMRLDRELPPRW